MNLIALTLLLPLSIQQETVEMPATQLPDVLTEAEVQELDAMANAVLEEGLAPNFVVGVLRNGKSAVYGYGSLNEAGDAPDGDTLYEIGSVSKVFTGVLLADAHLRGEFGLEDALADHAPEGTVVPQKGGDPICLWHLATHTSGLNRMPPGYAPPDRTDPFAGGTLDDIWAAVAKSKLRRAPLAKVQYSNFAVGLLGHVLAGPTQADYDRRLLERITGPLGMRDTHLALSPERAPRLAQGHDAAILATNHWTFDVLGGAGGILSSANDMVRFAQANLHPADDALGKALKLAQEPLHDMEGAPISIGLCWHMNSDTGVLWHNGQTGGYHAFFALKPEHDLAVIVLSGCSDGTTEIVGNRLYQVLMGGPDVPAFDLRRSVRVDPEILARYAGEYDLAMAGTFVIEHDAIGLIAKLGDQPALRLYAESETEFFYRAVDARITFEMEEDEVKALVLHQGGLDMRAPRKSD
jgi:serine-type D-Ala-D-Ala carboxypeptidase/endopeptidase